MAKYSLYQIKGAYIQKKDWEKQFFVSYLLFRPISFYVAYLVLFVTESPSRVAWVGFLLGISGCVSFLFISKAAIWPGILLLLLYALSDAVDGNVARVTNNVTHYGKLLDSMLGQVVENIYFFCLGLGVYLVGGNSYMSDPFGLGDKNLKLVLFAGIIIVITKLYVVLFGLNYEKFLILHQKKDDSSPDDPSAKIQSSEFRKHWWYLLANNIQAFNAQLLVLVLCAALKAVDLFFIFFACFYVFWAIVNMVFYAYRAHQRLR